jgi:hypothetical protein
MAMRWSAAVATRRGSPRGWRARGAGDPPAVGEFLGVHAEGPQPGHGQRDAVGLLDAQFGRVADRGGPGRGGHRDRQDGKFVDDVGDVVRGESTAVSRGPDRTRCVPAGSGPTVPAGGDVDAGAHALQDPDDADAGGVEAHVRQRDVRVRVDRPGHQPERRGGRVRGHVDVPKLPPGGSGEGGRVVLPVTGAPRNASSRSVWSRVGPGVVIVVVPSA